jgi:uncharacterized membrane protein
MKSDAKPRTWPRALQPFLSRPHLLAGGLVGIAAYFVAGHWAARETTRLLLAWDTSVVTFLALTFPSLADVDHARMKRRAIEHDEGRHLMLLLAVTATVFSVAAIGAELAAAKGQSAARESLRVGLAAGTIILSWVFVQTVFCIHYAHVYYMREDDGDGHKQGLKFADDDPPDYWDFLHFSFIIGATAQTADITIVSKELRRIGTVHSLLAFAFNTAILATMINLAANLF